MIRWFCLLLLLAGAAGCSGFTPFPAGPRPLAIGEKDPGVRVAICYNGLKTPPEQLQKLAQEQCPSDMVAERFDTDYRMDDCPLMTPARATFLCKTAK
jgi:hypothetical protein